MFHWRDGITFDRDENGGVAVHIPGRNIVDFVIPSADWGSIVASVSAQGENHDTYLRALSLHNGD